MGTLYVAELAPPSMVTLLSLPRSPAATNAPAWVTPRLTVRSAAGAGVAVTVKPAPVPSVTPSPPATLTTGPCGVSSLSVMTITTLPDVRFLVPPPMPESVTVPSPTVTRSSVASASSMAVTVRMAVVLPISNAEDPV